MSLFYRPLPRAPAPVWKTDLYASVDTNLEFAPQGSRDAGLIRLEKKVRYRDPLGGRIYPKTSPLGPDRSTAACMG